MDSLSLLFDSPARVKLLRLFTFNRTEAFSLDDIAARAKVGKPAARKELARLMRAGLVRHYGKGRSLTYRVNVRYPYLEALATFIRTTTVVTPEELLRLLKKVGSLRLVVLSGVFTGTQESTADLLVVGERINERSLERVVRSIEAELGREVRYAALSTADFSYRMGIYDRLVRDIFDYPHQALLDRIGL